MIYRRLMILLFAFVTVAIFSYSCNLANSPGAYELVTSTTPENGGTIDPSSGKFKEGSNIEITAVPASGYRFVEWSGDLSGSENPASLKFNNDKKVTAIFEADTQFDLNITVEGEGTVQEEVVPAKADYEPGTVVQLTAVAADGWAFSGWEGDLEGSENPVQITMDSEKNLTAVFRPAMAVLDIIVEGEGTVQEEILQASEDEVFAQTTDLENSSKPLFRGKNPSLNQNKSSIQSAFTDYEFGTQVQLTAQPAESWTFLRWEGDLEGSENPVSITMDSSKEITAVFMEIDEGAEIVISTDNVTVITQTSAVSGGNITVTGDATISDRGVCWDTSSEPDTNDSCTDNGSGTGEFSSSITGLSPSTTYYARAYAISSEGTFYGNEESFTTLAVQPDLYTISISSTGQGSVSLNPDQDEYEEDENVVLTASPEQGWQFSRWEGDQQGTQNPVTITMDENKTITAVFEEQVVENQVTVTTHSASSITFNSAVSGGNINAEAGVSVNQRGICWDVNENPNVSDECTDDGSGAGTFTSSITNLSPSTSYFVRAYAITDGEIYYGDQQTFTTAEEPVMYTVNVVTDGEGIVSIAPNRDEYEEGSEITLAAIPSEDWQFQNWAGDLEGTENPVTLIVTDNLEITAVFIEEPDEFTVDVTTDGQGTVSLEPDQQTYTDGETVTVTAIPDEGWEFTSWSGDLSGAENPTTITVTSNMNISAEFTEVVEEFTIDITTTGQGTVSLEPVQATYTDGETVTVTATADEGWEFTSWSGDLTGVENPTVITVTSNMSISAEFVEVISEVNLGVILDGNGSVELDPEGGTYAPGQQVTLLAVADEGFQFTNWSGAIESVNNPETVTINENMQVTATFELVSTSGPSSMSVSHGYSPAVTPGNVSPLEAQRTYPVIQANWPGPGGDKRWLGRNLGATAAPVSVNDNNADRAGWYFQFNRSRGYYEDDTTHERVPGFPVSDTGVPVHPDFDSDWIDDDPCTILLGGTWRIPTQDEWNAVADADAEDQLNLHYTGYVSHLLGALFGLGEGGTYWTSNQYKEAPPNAYAVGFFLGEIEKDAIWDMDMGFTVRCIEA